MAGIDMRKEKRAAEGLSNFRSIPPVMVDPDLETPGKREKDWKSPMIAASSHVSSFRVRVRFPKISATTRKSAVTKRKIAVAVMELNASSTLLFINTPKTPAGMVARIRYHPSRALSLPNGCRSINPFTNPLMISQRSFQK
jgi:hypothetical protein